MRILVTGGTGHLGQAIMSGLKREGHQVRILARQPRSNSEVEWIKGDLATGDGVREAVVDVDAIIHAATNSPAARRGRFKLGDFLRSPADVDVNGTSALLTAAAQADVKQFVHVSIVGLEHLRQMPYSRRKLEAEQIVRSSNVPWSIVRATGSIGCSSECSTAWSSSGSWRCRRTPAWRPSTQTSSLSSSSNASPMVGPESAKTSPDRRH
jgi:nucleoside-diphosphate-sugar epimerase